MSHSYRSETEHFARGDDPHVGPVLLSNILRKGPRPRIVGSRRSVTMDRRPSTADSVRSSSSIGSVGSNMSNMSNMSRESFSDRFGRADKKQKRLLMIQKKIELHETMQKRLQLQHRVRGSPPSTRRGPRAPRRSSGICGFLPRVTSVLPCLFTLPSVPPGPTASPLHSLFPCLLPGGRASS